MSEDAPASVTTGRGGAIAPQDSAPGGYGLPIQQALSFGAACRSRTDDLLVTKPLSDSTVTWDLPGMHERANRPHGDPP